MPSEVKIDILFLTQSYHIASGKLEYSAQDQFNDTVMVLFFIMRLDSIPIYNNCMEKGSVNVLLSFWKLDEIIKSKTYIILLKWLKRNNKLKLNITI